jgi:hypothetical protein
MKLTNEPESQGQHFESSTVNKTGTLADAKKAIEEALSRFYNDKGDSILTQYSVSYSVARTGILSADDEVRQNFTCSIQADL